MNLLSHSINKYTKTTATDARVDFLLNILCGELNIPAPVLGISLEKIYMIRRYFVCDRRKNVYQCLVYNLL